MCQKENTMLQVLAPVDNIRFDIEDALDKQLYSYPLPFTGMDSKSFKNEIKRGFVITLNLFD